MEPILLTMSCLEIKPTSWAAKFSVPTCIWTEAGGSEIQGRSCGKIRHQIQDDIEGNVDCNMLRTYKNLFSTLGIFLSMGWKNGSPVGWCSCPRNPLPTR